VRRRYPSLGSVPGNSQIKLSIVSAYYDNAEMARFIADWYNRFSAETRSRIELVLVDDGSRKAPLDSLELSLNLPHQLYRIHRDIPWNQDGARNIGCSHARGPWLLLTDADHVFEEAEVRRAIELERPDKPYLMLRKHLDGGEYINPHINSFLISKKRYWDIGGYDEIYRGHYGSDKFFLPRVFSKKKRPVFPICASFVEPDRIADAATTSYSRKRGRRARWDRQMIHFRKRLGLLPEVSLFLEDYELISAL
jgi:glycosyltransferase involved in cell wall biosynthesis